MGFKCYPHLRSMLKPGWGALVNQSNWHMYSVKKTKVRSTPDSMVSGQTRTQNLCRVHRHVEFDTIRWTRSENDISAQKTVTRCYLLWRNRTNRVVRATSSIVKTGCRSRASTYWLVSGSLYEPRSTLQTRAVLISWMVRNTSTTQLTITGMMKTACAFPLHEWRVSWIERR